MRMILAGILIFSAGVVSAQLEKLIGEQANKAYSEGNFELADSLYAQSLNISPDWSDAAFNQADAQYRQGNFEDAANAFGSLAEKLPSGANRAQAYHNLGNSHMSMEAYDKAVGAYRNALLENPSDEDTRRNLAMAQKQLKQQQQEQEQNENGEGDQDQEQEQGQEQSENQDENGEGDQEQEQEKEQDGEGDEQKDQNQDGQGDQQKEQEQKQGQEPLQVSKEDAARILESLKQDERAIQAKLQRQKGKGKKVKIEKDW